MSADPDLISVDGLWERHQWAGLPKGAVGPGLVIVIFEFGEDQAQMGVVPDQGPVQELTACGQHPALHDRIHPGRPDRAYDDPDARIGE